MKIDGTTDDELASLLQVARAIKNLSKEQIERILRYAADRHGVSLDTQPTRIVQPTIIRERYVHPWWQPYTTVWMNNNLGGDGAAGLPATTGSGPQTSTGGAVYSLQRSG